MAEREKKGHGSATVGVIAGLVVAAALVATGAVLYKYISDHANRASDESDESQDLEADAETD